MKNNIYSIALFLALLASGFSMGYVITNYIVKIYKHEVIIMDLNVEKGLNSFQTDLSKENCDTCLNKIVIAPGLLPTYDSLLKKALAQEKILANYDFAFSKDTINWLAISEDSDTAQLKKTEFIRNLGNENVLHLYFPNKRNYIIYRIRKTLIISSVLLLSILFSLIFLATTVKKQSELATQKNNFINNITHELKTPIATIDFALANIENEKNIHDPDKIRAITQIIRAENKRMNRQVERVLSAAKAEKGALEMESEIVDMHEIIAVLCEGLTVKFQQKNGKIVQKLTAKNSKIQGDHLHLTNAISNLLDNAFKYSKEQPNITIETKNIKGNLIIKVTDRGIGIAKAAQNLVFEQFYRVSTEDLHDVKGFGLGLSYVKAIVLEHKGKISLKSKLGQGSSFRIELPRMKNGAV